MVYDPLRSYWMDMWLAHYLVITSEWNASSFHPYNPRILPHTVGRFNTVLSSGYRIGLLKSFRYVSVHILHSFSNGVEIPAATNEKHKVDHLRGISRWPERSGAEEYQYGLVLYSLGLVEHMASDLQRSTELHRLSGTPLRWWSRLTLLVTA